MAGKKARRFVLGSLLAAAAIGGPKIANSIQERREEKKELLEEQEWEAEQQAIKEEEAREKAEEDYYYRVRDSIRQRNGYADYDKELRSMRDSHYDQYQIEMMEYGKTLAGTMEKELVKTGWPIIEQGEQSIRNLLDKYNLRYDNYFSKDRNEYGGVDFFEELFVGIEFDGWRFGLTESWQRHVDDIVDESYYGDMRKAEIKQKVADVIESTERKLAGNRKAVEDRFADYYSAAHLKDDEIGVGQVEGSEYGSYEALNYYASADPMVTVRSVDVYDSNLDVDFFGEPGAKYKLLSVAPGRWQVVKTRANGRVEKTPVFTDHKDFETYMRPWSSYWNDNHWMDEDVHSKAIPLPRVGDSDFSFSPGSNMGVRVYYSEVVKVERHRKQWQDRDYSAAERRTVDSLQNQIKLKEDLRDKRYEADNEADSIADIMVQRRFGSRGQ